MKTGMPLCFLLSLASFASAEDRVTVTDCILLPPKGTELSAVKQAFPHLTEGEPPADGGHKGRTYVSLLHMTSHHSREWLKDCCVLNLVIVDGKVESSRITFPYLLPSDKDIASSVANGILKAYRSSNINPKAMPWLGKQ